MSTPSIAVLGAGANGASIGADLFDAGLDPVLIEQWPAHVEAIRRDGLRVEMPSGTRQVRPRTLHLCEVATLREPFDLVLLVTKAYDARWAAALIEPYLAPDGAIAAVQNGMTTQTVADIVGADRCVGTVIEISSTMIDPGVVHRHVDPERSWFAVDATARRGDEVADVLSYAGEVARVDDISSAKWMKLVSNASVLVPTAALGLPMVDAIEVPGMRALMLQAGREALRVAGEHQVLPIFGLTRESLAASGDVVETMLDMLYTRFTVPGATTTVLQDWRKGRHSEVDDINGAVVAAGRRLGIPTPINEAIVEVGHAIERGELEPALAALPRMQRG